VKKCWSDVNKSGREGVNGRRKTKRN